MLNLFRKPIEKETLDDWSKIANDIAKVAILAIPVILYGKDPIYIKSINTLLLVFGAYCGLLTARHIRRIQAKRKEEAL
ncbi:hypothetical protein A1D23_09465 [Chelonobacter oris]|uniref:hypothetical protein n=1 Tax=Chelonobacter oris TaxID=505317 RepID=UPI0024485E36|nr:hypothetical protein [Chelonobacter oris]MDH3000648.1 hypothetical protein [Chelonobacter oris]